MRQTRYNAIADELRHRIDRGSVAAGHLLPSEASLSVEFAASRVTVRRALEVLRAENRVESHQGYGWMVRSEPVRQPLTTLGTIESQLASLGVVPERRVLSFAFIDAPPRVAEVLGTNRVLEVIRCNLADGEPFARVTVWCPEQEGAALSKDDVEARSFYDLLDMELGGADQTIGAQLVSESDAEVLGVPLGSPVLVCERITNDSNQRPVLMSEHVFPGHRTVFAAELPVAEPAEVAAGLRLVP